MGHVTAIWLNLGNVYCKISDDKRGDWCESWYPPFCSNYRLSIMAGMVKTPGKKLKLHCQVADAFIASFNRPRRACRR